MKWTQTFLIIVYPQGMIKKVYGKAKRFQVFIILELL